MDDADRTCNTVDRKCIPIQTGHTSDGGNQTCTDGMFATSSGLCVRLHGPGGRFSRLDYATNFCVNSRYNITSEICEGSEYKYSELNEFCGVKENGEEFVCKEPLDCYKWKCRERAYLGERCHRTGGVLPPCQRGWVCNLGYCVAPHTVGGGQPADHPRACVNGEVTFYSTCRDNCTTFAFTRTVGYFRNCEENVLVDHYSRKNNWWAANPSSCESGKNSNNRCVPTSKDDCYSNLDCDVADTYSFCYQPKFSSKEPGKCLGLGTHYFKRLMNQEKRYDTCRNVKDCERDLEELEKLTILRDCSINCFSRRKARRSPVNTRTGFEELKYTYDCEAKTKN
jgi:hypothetical protein